jgi:succinate-acetate transporter protein
MLTLIILDLATLGGMTGLTTVGGYLEMVLGALAWMIVAGEIINDVSGRALVPFPVTPFHHLPTVAGEPESR